MIRNLTPHPLNIHLPDGTVREILPDPAGPARVSTSSTQVGEIDNIPVVATTYGDTEGLPAPEAGTLLVVSALVRAACPDREDLVSPADLVRDDQGRIVGCRALTR